MYVEYQNKWEYFCYLTKDNFLNETDIKLFIADDTTEFKKVKVAFRSIDERNLFKQLVKIKTIGLKTSFTY
ncbi:hypothetical protein [Mesoplasma melaleucae]|uniref:hypothetical protein n=1 Tax=Mesoplasma melaleucae TaxID=81459 RepID=UPI00069124B4|nr:hypothetical protein [Mesoplasma melaleucae]